MLPPSPFDRALKVLFRRAAHALFRLAGVEVDPAAIHTEDVTINLPEHRADQVFVVGADDDPNRWGLHAEYQLDPDPRQLRGWNLKNAAFNAQLEIEVPLVVLYLRRGERATFPDAYTVAGGGFVNTHQFHTIRLWEHADRIRSGELSELAPLLVLCEETPTEETLRRERELILGYEAGYEVRADLLAVATMVGCRFFARDLVLKMFQEELQMLKEADFFQEWIDEAEARGEARGAARATRDFLLHQLRKRFGELPQAVVDQVENADPNWCTEMGERLFGVESLEELGIGENGAA